VFFLQLSRFKHWLMRGPTDAERARICWALAGMDWSVCVLYERGIPIAVRWYDCGFSQPSLCLLPDEPTSLSRRSHRVPLPSTNEFPHTWLRH
jgi:hypothetical protein